MILLEKKNKSMGVISQQNWLSCVNDK
jgi:hypothetical protein